MANLGAKKSMSPLVRAKPSERFSVNSSANDRTYPLPSNERERLQELYSYSVLGTPAELAYDNVLATIKRIFEVPMAVISFVDDRHQWFKAKLGTEVCETAREDSFCTYAILDTKPLVIENALLDDRFKDNVLVANPPHVRFYAGAPLITPRGFCIGGICAIDSVPRKATDRQLAALEASAKLIVRFLEARKCLAGSFRFGKSLAEMNGNLSSLKL